MKPCDAGPIYSWDAIKCNNYKLILAKTPCQRSQGLQFAATLPKNTLLFFRGIPPGVLFHTRNCQFPIDIIPVTNSGQVLATWYAFPETEAIGPTPHKTVNVIEAPLGWAIRNGIKPGDIIPMFAIGYCVK